MRRYISLLPALLLFPALAMSQPIRVVTTIKPIALIVENLVAHHPALEVQVDTLVPASADPHHYALKVSDRQKLSQADLIIWIGPNMERFLTRLVAQFPAEKLITVEDIEGMNWPETAGEGELLHTHESHDHDHEGGDPHFWLNPDNAGYLQTELAARLASLTDTPLTEPLAQAKADLAQLDHELTAQLALLQAMPYAVYHDGYRHFTDRFGLQSPLVVTPGGDRAPGVKYMLVLQERLPQMSCLLVESVDNNALATSLVKQTQVAQVRTDILGASPQIESYEQLLRGVAAAFVECAGGSKTTEQK